MSTFHIVRRKLVRRALIGVCMSLFLGMALPAGAQPPGPQTPAAAPSGQPPTDPQQIRQELERLRQEFEAVRDSYGARLAALEAKLASTAPPAAATTPGGVALVPPLPQAPPPPAQPPPQPGLPGEVQVPSGAAGAGGPTGTLPVYGNPSATSKIFNPDIAVIGNFLGTAGENDVAPGPTLGLNEAEASLQAVVDPYARADFFFAFSPEGVEIEEGYLTFSTLPGGLLAKVGKLKQQVGKVNTLHAHALPWVDTPLALGNLLGGEEGLADAGVSVSKLLLNPWFFLEATGEVYQGNSGVFQAHERDQVSWAGRLRGYRDLTESTNVDLGVSLARGHNDAGAAFTTRLLAVDATFRYRPLQRAIYRRFIGRTELFWSRRGQATGNASSFGMYASADYQFARRWFAGGRLDWSQRAFDSSLTDKGVSFIATYWPSEFSQVRGQFRRTRYAEGVMANEALFQFLFSIGAHGAHIF